MLAVDISTWIIDYDEILSGALHSGLSVVETLARRLPSAWLRAYRRSVAHRPRICEVVVDGFSYIFDDPGATAHMDSESEFICERVVAVHGRSTPVAGRPRAMSRMRGYTRGAADADSVNSGEYDRGHFIAHASGGGMDINIFPQLTEVNRGRSARGKIYRRMERYLADHPGTYCFSRSIYSGWTDHPYVIELGLLEPKNLWVERFSNCSNADEMRAIEAAFTERLRTKT